MINPYSQIDRDLCYKIRNIITGSNHWKISNNERKALTYYNDPYSIRNLVDSLKNDCQSYDVPEVKNKIHKVILITIHGNSQMKHMIESFIDTDQPDTDTTPLQLKLAQVINYSLTVDNLRKLLITETTSLINGKPVLHTSSEIKQRIMMNTLDNKLARKINAGLDPVANAFESSNEIHTFRNNINSCTADLDPINGISAAFVMLICLVRSPEIVAELS